MKLLIFLQCCVLLCKLAAGYEGGGCREALGMENGKIANDQITASSEKKAYRFRAVNGRLHYYDNQRGRRFGWRPKSSSSVEWLQVDLLHDNYTVTGVATQGCSIPKRKKVLSVTKYELAYSNDGKVFYADHQSYAGNTDKNTVVYHTLDTPIKARYVRFNPKSWKNGICMRVELYGKITTACDSSPCLNGGTCFEDQSGEEYICKCSSGWRGNNCEKEITVPHEDNFQFNYPNKVVDDYVRLDVSSSASDVTAFTVFMWIKVGDQSDDGTLFSYAIEDEDNELLITDYSRFKILIGGRKVTLDGVTANDDKWHHICTTWENGEGSWHFYIDAELKGSGRDFQTGHVISSGGIVILGQDQDEYGGGFESDQSFNGKMFGVNMWDYEMSEDEIVQLSSSCFGPEGNYLKWSDFKGGEEGDVEIEAPTTCLPLQ